MTRCAYDKEMQMDALDQQRELRRREEGGERAVCPAAIARARLAANLMNEAMMLLSVIGRLRWAATSS
eukprot:8492471-Heterocapsa_arctica.AAC.2